MVSFISQTCEFSQEPESPSRRGDTAPSITHLLADDLLYLYSIGYHRSCSTSQNAQSSGPNIMPHATLDETFVMLCDWRGRCIWTSSPDAPAKVGGFIWDELSNESQDQAKATIGKVIAVRESGQLEVTNQSGSRFRVWVWPLESPEVAVCILGLRIPANLELLTQRERECVELLGIGTETQQIARQLDLSLSTVHTHLKHAREKLGLSTIESLISFAARYCYPANMALGPGEHGTRQAL
jgi:DNA-binding CsgD family transcriptional regulator